LPICQSKRNALIQIRGCDGSLMSQDKLFSLRHYESGTGGISWLVLNSVIFVHSLRVMQRAMESKYEIFAWIIQ
jgi:hypothetical protein